MNSCSFLEDLHSLSVKYPREIDSSFLEKLTTQFTSDELRNIDQHLYKKLPVESKRYFLVYAQLLAPTLNHIDIKKSCFASLQEKRKHFLKAVLRDAYIPESFDCDSSHPYFHPRVHAIEGDVFFDCGANSGDTLAHVMEATNFTAVVHAFEPMERTFAKMEAFVRNNEKLNSKKEEGGIHLKKSAVGRTTGYLDFLMLSDEPLKEDGLGSRIRKDRDVPGEGVERASVVTIDDYVKGHDIEEVDFVKMDIEGAETMALEGAKETIRKHKPRLAICLYHENLEKGGSDLCHVPEKILDIHPGYNFYFRHHAMERCLFYEAVLYCIDANDEKYSGR